MSEETQSEAPKAEETLSDTPPDRLCVHASSPWYNEPVLVRGIGIRFKGQERTDVEEYCVSENWIRAPVAKTKDRKGNPLVIKMTGPVEPYFLSPAPTPEG